MNITPETLSSIKKDIRRFYKLYNELAEYWGEDSHPAATIIAVLLQNAGFDGSQCGGYEHQRAVDKVLNILGLLRSLDEYHQDYMTHYPYTEVDMIVMGGMYSDLYSEMALNEPDLNPLI